MDGLKSQDVAINLELMKRCGIFQMINKNNKTIFNWNPYRISFFAFAVYIQCLVLFIISGLFIKTNVIKSNEFEIILSLHSSVQLFLCLWKIFIFLYKINTTDFTVLFDVTRLNFMTSKRCCKHIIIMRKCRKKIIKTTNCFFYFMNLLIVEWILCPLVINKFMTDENANQSCLQNIFNFRYPIAPHTYNQYYVIFFVIETTIILFIPYAIFIFDVYVLSLCFIINTQFEVLSRAFESIGHEEIPEKPGEY